MKKKIGDLTLLSTLVRKQYDIGKDDRESAFTEFSEFFLPERCWPGRGKGTFAWVATVEPLLRRLFVDDMRGKAYHNWRAIRITDYFSSVRCYQCQKYGHLAKNCKNAKCAGTAQRTATPTRSVPTGRVRRNVALVRAGNWNIHTVSKATLVLHS